MKLLSIQKLNPVKLILGLVSLLNIIQLIRFGQEFFENDGLLPYQAAISIDAPTYLSLLSPSFLKFLPYFSSDHLNLIFFLHILIVVLFICNFRPKLVIPLLFIFENFLLIRLARMSIAGNYFVLYILLIFLLEECLPASKKWYASAVWVSQFSILYLLIGANKDIDLWVISGKALQKFHYLDATCLGRQVYELGQVGLWMSRLVIPIEILAPLILMYFFIWKKKVNKKIVLTLIFLISCVHIGSFFLFSLFTFPLIGFAILTGLYRGIINCEDKVRLEKLLIFLIVTIIYIFPYMKLPPSILGPPIFIRRWTLFSKVPPVKAGPFSVATSKLGVENHTMLFTTSFHWTRYRYMLADEHPYRFIFRPPLIKHLCKKFQADHVIWRTPNGKTLNKCPI